MSIQIRNLDFSYGEATVLKDISTTQEKGNLVCVLGKNGVGKSTLFRCILHMLPAYTGEILVDDREIGSYSARELASKVAYVPQGSENLHHYSVEQMILMGTCASMSFWGNPGKRQYDMVREALKILHIEHLRGRDYAALSGGEQRMVLIARAIAQQAKMIIMDEPCSSLDYGNQIRIMELCRQLTGAGYLIIQSTHNPDHALLYADQVLVLQDGRMPFQGEPGEILTEDRLSELYEVAISLEQIKGSDRKICVPKNKKRGETRT